MGELREHPDHRGLCTWHEGEVRCNAPAFLGSGKRAACYPHLKVFMAGQLDPEAYAQWLENHKHMEVV